MRCIVTGALGLALAGCFDPNPPAGRACGPDMSCPPGQECVADVCVPEGSRSDGGADAPACDSWSSRLFSACDLPLSDAEVVINGDALFDSDTRELGGSDGQPVETLILSVDGIEAVVVVAGTFVVAPGAHLQLTGTRPVVVAAWNRVEIVGTLSAASGAGLRGAGSNPTEHCPIGVPAPGGEITGGVGGSSAVAPGGPGGSAEGLPGPMAAAPSEGLLRAGCDGATTSKDMNGGPIGGGGLGGGAVALSSPGPIQISGRVLAGGGGGAAGSSVVDTNTTSTGGAGGGAGGHIVIESPTIGLEGAVLAANGGGGGGGASDQADMNGPGSDALPSIDPAPGGVGTKENVGGNGGASEICAGAQGGPGIAPGESGGGGGGACGLIELAGEVAGPPAAIISPPPQLR